MLEARLLLLERALLPLERLLLLLELVLLAGQRVGLLRQLLLLALPLRLLLLELLLQVLGLLLLVLEVTARLRLGIDLRRHEERPVVAGAEARGHQVIGLALGRRFRRRADVFLTELEGEKRDDERRENRRRGCHREPWVRRHLARPPPPEATLGGLRSRTDEGGQA